MRSALVCLILLATLGGRQESVVQERTFSLPSKSAGAVLTSSAYPRGDFRVEVEVEYATPGSILDTVGINAAPVGSWTLSVTAEGQVLFGEWDGSKWHQLLSKARLAATRRAVLVVERKGETIQLTVDGSPDATLALGVPLSGAPIYVGDFKGDESWGQGYNIHQGLIGTVKVIYLGIPKAAPSTHTRVEDRASLLSADEISALTARIESLEKERGFALSFTFVGAMERAERDAETRTLYERLYQASGQRESMAILITGAAVSVHYTKKLVDGIGRDKLIAAITGLPKPGRRVLAAHSILDALFGGGKPVETIKDAKEETPDREARNRKPRRPIQGAVTQIEPGKPATIAVGAGSVTIPAQEVPIELTTAAETIQRPVPGLQLFGPSVAIQWEGAVNPATFTPIVKFPASAIDSRQGVNIVRIGDAIIDGDLSGDEPMVLPTIRTKDGGVMAVDTFTPPTPDRVVASLGPEKLAFTTRYGLASYTDALNWKNEPDLIRMAPSDGPYERQPFYQLKEPEHTKLKRQPIKNVIVLVHGHNEYEKGGYTLGDASQPWVVSYKRDVWTIFWKTFKEQCKDYVDTTAVYEFVYPTYRPTFEPEMGVDPLGLSLAKAIANDFDISYAADKELSFNLYIVAHSMGGLVSRAGVNRFKDAKLRNTATPATILEKWLDKIVTWGSPHHGSPLVTMRYLLTGGYDIESTATVIPVSLLKQSNGFNVFVNYFAAMDTPGERALKWSNHRPLNLASGGWVVPKRALWESGDMQAFDDTFSLDKGSWLYNMPLVAFNRADRFKSKVVPFFGVTRKTIAKTGSLWKSSPYETITGRYNLFSRLLNSSDIGTGAWLITWLYQNQDNVLSHAVYQSDGAVPVESMIGEGLFQRNVFLGDTDHEQYYGAPAKGKWTSDLAASDTSYKTLFELGFTGDKKGKNYPPRLELKMPLPQATPIAGEAAFQITGQLTWNGDAKPGTRILEAQLIALDPRAQDLTGKRIPCKLEIADNGAISGVVPAKLLPAANSSEKPTLRVIFKDKKELDSQPASGADEILPLLQKTQHMSATLIGVVEDSNEPNMMGRQSKVVVATYGAFGATVGAMTKLASEYGKQLPTANVVWNATEFSYSIDTGPLQKKEERKNWGTTVSTASGKLTISGRYDAASRAVKDVAVHYERKGTTQFTPDPNWRPRSTVESFYPPKEANSKDATVMTLAVGSVPLAGPPLKDLPQFQLYIAFALDGKTLRGGITGTSTYDLEGLNTTPQHTRTKLVLGPPRVGIPYEAPGIYIHFAIPK